jgi:cytoskeletal protein RodZ
LSRVAGITRTIDAGEFMDGQEQHQQQKAKEREQKNKEEKVYEEMQQKRRLPVKSVWLIVVGVVLTALIVYVWIVGLFRTPN